MHRGGRPTSAGSIRPRAGLPSGHDRRVSGRQPWATAPAELRRRAGVVLDGVRLRRRARSLRSSDRGPARRSAWPRLWATASSTPWNTTRSTATADCARPTTSGPMCSTTETPNRTVSSAPTAPPTSHRSSASWAPRSATWPGRASRSFSSIGGRGHRRYLRAAVRIGTWITDNAVSEGSLGGFRFGVKRGRTPHPQRVHRAQHRLHLVLRPALPGHGRAAAGVARRDAPSGSCRGCGRREAASSTPDPMTATSINLDPIPLDPQTWSWLALRDRRYARALEWASDTLAVTDDASEPNSQVPAGVTVSGVTFSTASLTSTASYNGIQVNQQGVWLEGTAQLRDLTGRPRRSPGPSPRGCTAPAGSDRAAPAGVRHHARNAATRRRCSAAGRRWRRRGIELDRHRIRLRLFPGPARRRDQLVPDGRRPSQSVAVRGLGVTTVADVTCPGGPSE